MGTPATLGRPQTPRKKRERPRQKGGAESLTEIKKEQLNNDPDSEISALPELQKHGPDAEEILSYMQANGMIDLQGVAASVKKSETERIIKEKHPYKI